MTCFVIAPLTYASKDVVSYNFTKQSSSKKIESENASKNAPEHHDVKKINPVPANTKVTDNLAQLEKETRYQSKNIQDLFFKRGALYDDAEVTAYINAVAHRIMAGSGVAINSDVNFKIIRDPTVNAFAFVDGSIYIHTGALARLENEAQLAFLLAHEISHSLNKDVVYNIESYHNKTIAYKVADVLLAPTSVFFGVLGDAAQIGSNLLYVTSVLGYSRDIEARADKDAILWVTRQGYDPYEAASLMQVFINESDKYSRGIEIFFLMSHPLTRYRLDTLKKLIHDTYGKQVARGDVNSEEFLHNMVKIKLYNAALNIKLDRLEHARDNIAWVLGKYKDNPEAHYLDGEIYRIGVDNTRLYRYELNSVEWQKLDARFKKENLAQVWADKAKEAYLEGMKDDPSYVNSYKGLGMLYVSKKDRQAIAYLQKYLDLYPGAPDKRYIDSIIKKLN